MLKNCRCRNLTILNVDGTNLEDTTATIEELLSEMEVHLNELSRRVDNHSIQQESIVYARLNEQAAFVVYVNPECRNNPYLFRYNRKTHEPTDTIMYDEFIQLYKSSSAWEYFKFRCGKINELTMDKYFAPGEIEKIRAISKHYDDMEDAEEWER